MTRRALPALVSTGRPETAAFETAVRRALDQVHGQFGSELDAMDAASVPYTAAVAADWSGTSPTTIAEALDRIAAALGPIP